MIVATVVRIGAMTVATAAMTATTAVADPGCCADSPMGGPIPKPMAACRCRVRRELIGR
jgi:hypothetical protein